MIEEIRGQRMFGPDESSSNI